MIRTAKAFKSVEQIRKGIHFSRYRLIINKPIHRPTDLPLVFVSIFVPVYGTVQPF